MKTRDSSLELKVANTHCCELLTGSFPERSACGMRECVLLRLGGQTLASSNSSVVSLIAEFLPTVFQPKLRKVVSVCASVL